MHRRFTRGHDFAAPLNTLQTELQRLFEHYTQHAPPGPPTPDDDAPPTWSPPLDVYETPEEMIVLIDLPGIDPLAVEVSVTGRGLTIRGRRRAEEPAPRHERAPERPQGAFSREVELTADVEVHAVRAEARDGVVTIHLPKLATARARTIPVRGG